MTKTLEEIINDERKLRHENGDYGINACKKSIKWDVEHLHKNLYQLLGEFVERANHDIFFNRAMILACWELINNK